MSHKTYRKGIDGGNMPLFKKGKTMNKIQTVLKSRTFWGGLGYAVVRYLESQDIISTQVSAMIESLFIGFGLYGARNAKV
jgi:hypothetical protein